MKQVRQGTVEGTGSAITVKLGWEPDYVKVVNIDDTDPASIEWYRGMTAAHGVKLTGGGSPAHTFITSLGITPFPGTQADDEAGFVIGADTAVNKNGDTIAFVAIRN